MHLLEIILVLGGTLITKYTTIYYKCSIIDNMKNELQKKVLDSQENGIITSKRITELGIRRNILHEMVNNNTLIKISRGIYIKSDDLEDELLAHQIRYKKGIFSHDTALYLHGFAIRAPLFVHMTFPRGYNSYSINKEQIKCTHVSNGNYQLGIIYIDTPFGNRVKCYDIERTLCDIVRGNKIDLQNVLHAMKMYANYKHKDITKLYKYAKRLKVEPKIRRYMEVLLNDE